MFVIILANAVFAPFPCYVITVVALELRFVSFSFKTRDHHNIVLL